MTKGTLIQPDALLRFIEDAGEVGVRSIGFIGDGEPTLNPGLYDAVVTARDSGVDTGMATNGLLLDMDHADSMLANMTFIRFNLSAADEQSFRQIHQSHPRNYQPLIEKIAELVRIKRAHQHPCTLGIQMVLIPENFSQIRKMAELGRELGVDYLELRNRRRLTDWPTKENYVTFRRAIEPDVESNLMAIPRKQRAVIRKALEVHCSERSCA